MMSTTSQCTRENALSILKLYVDVKEQKNREAYLVDIETVSRFNMVRRFVEKGASYPSDPRFVQIFREVTRLCYLNGCSEGMCAKYIRIICKANLHGINGLLCCC